jgi:4-hydroxythreonine-4-phosphate dehydrogenase
LANQLPAAAGLAGDAARLPSISVRGPILTVVGSLSSVSRKQAETLFQSRQMTRIDIPAILLSGEDSHAKWGEIQIRLAATLAGGGDVLLVISDAEPADMSRGLTLCHSLARLVEPLVDFIGGVISTGGETTRAILSVFGVTSLRVVGEVETGIPLSVARGERPIPVVSKAGAFGSAETLMHCYDVLARARQDAADGGIERNNTHGFQNQPL